ncbi:MAG TPA: site-2 protease family protein [Candidatus Acidoferrales bacterium]|nr:site-2 protease family protein [Candidatus Acidoferrales bacterium]
MNGNGDGNGRIPVGILESRFPQVEHLQPARIKPRPIWPATLLFLLTVVSTLIVGSEFALSYAQNREPFSTPETFAQMIVQPLEHPGLLALGVPFSFTLLLILMAHELGHYFTCRIYGIDASYPYFIPAPTLFGTFGAFIRIRSPITTRKALFDVGISGPVVGFILAVPAMAYGVAHAKIVPNVQDTAAIVFGTPPLMRLLIEWFHPNVEPSWILLHPVARAAWVGLFATALNLLPLWQLDGGHIVYSLSSKLHQRISLAAGLGLIALGIYSWLGWIFWGFVLTVLALRFRHPPLYDPWERLGRARWIWAVVALAIFILCFTPWPASNP